MDYAFRQAMGRSLPRVKSFLLLYDIMCQWYVNFRRRCYESPRLDAVPPDVRIQRGIGLFHVHGHKAECFARYSPSLISGAGMVDGEIIETLWSSLNDVAGSTRSSSTFTRQELLDAHMDYSNWKKTTRMCTLYCYYYFDF